MSQPKKVVFVVVVDVVFVVIFVVVFVTNFVVLVGSVIEEMLLLLFLYLLLS